MSQESLLQNIETTDHANVKAEVDELGDYYAWLNRGRDRAAQISQAHLKGIHPSLRTVQVAPWENPHFTDEERLQVLTGARVIDMNKQKRLLSTAAFALAASTERSTFFDDIKCDYLGDSHRLGQFREISPAHNLTPFGDIEFDYNQGRLNAFTEAGTVIHVRETLDPAAQTLQKRFFILAIDLMQQDVRRLYADNQTKATPDYDNPHRFTEDIYLRADPNSVATAQFQSYPPSENHILKPYIQQLLDNHSQQRQPQLRKSAKGSWKYKPEGFGEFSRLHPIARLDEERELLGMIARSTGYQIDERGALNGGESYLGITAA